LTSWVESSRVDLCQLREAAVEFHLVSRVETINANNVQDAFELAKAA